MRSARQVERLVAGNAERLVEGGVSAVRQAFRGDQLVRVAVRVRPVFSGAATLAALLLLGGAASSIDPFVSGGVADLITTPSRIRLSLQRADEIRSPAFLHAATVQQAEPVSHVLSLASRDSARRWRPFQRSGSDRPVAAQSKVVSITQALARRAKVTSINRAGGHHSVYRAACATCNIRSSSSC